MPIKVQGGKEYKQVTERLQVFWEKYKGWKILPRVVRVGDGGVIMEAVIEDDSGNERSKGHAEGFYNGSDKVIEKTETTAVGRALAFLDKDLMGGEIASADEIASWMQHSNDQKLLEHVAAVRDHWDSVFFIKKELHHAETTKNEGGDDWIYLEQALEAWRELGEDVMKVLWRAPSKGGIFTTLERKLLDEASTEDFKRRKAGG
mgnify:CR=1 FL=1